MNGVPEFYEVKMKQTSKGIWYCDGFTASTESPNDTIRVAEIAMTRIERILKAHNVLEQPQDVDKWKKASEDYKKGAEAGLIRKKEEK